MLVHILPVILLYGPGIVKITETRNLPYFYQLIFQDPIQNRDRVLALWRKLHINT